MRGAALDLLLFTLVTALVAARAWTATDLVWSLWISSLLVGTGLMLTVGFATLFTRDLVRLVNRKVDASGQGVRVSTPEDAVRTLTLPATLVLGVVWLFLGRISHPVVLGMLALSGLAAALVIDPGLLARGGLGPRLDLSRAPARAFLLLPYFLLLTGFFGLHFGFFHAIHGILMNGMLPLTGANPFGTTPDETARQVLDLVTTAASRYWPFALCSAISARSLFARALGEPDASLMFMPYKGVMKMHLTIFLFAGLGAAGLDRTFAWVVLLLYFLPLAALRGLVRADATPAEAPQRQS